MAIEDIKKLINEFGKLVGLAELELDEGGYCCLSFDDHIVNLEYDPEGNRVLLYSNVGDVPDTDREKFYEILLDANLLWKFTSGATLSVSKNDGFVVLAYAFTPSITSFVDFQQILENFINVTEAWKKRISEFSTESDPRPEPMSPEPGMRV